MKPGKRALYAIGLAALLAMLASVHWSRARGWRPAWPFHTYEDLRGDLVFAAIGDSGTGNKDARAVAVQMYRLHATCPFQFVLMLRDNIYPKRCGPRPFKTCFEEP